MMTSDDNDAGENLLAGIDLHTWRVPPPIAVHRPSLLVRALAPATQAAKQRPRLRWLLAGLVLVNAAIAALLVILLARPAPSSTPTVVHQAAGGGSVDAQVRDLLARLEAEQRELESRLAEIKELRALVTELSEKVRLYEQQDANRRERTVPRPRDRQTPSPTPTPTPAPACDEVGCVLGNYAGACCAKFRISQSPPPPPPPNNGPPENLTRQMISTGIANVKARVTACGDFYKIKGKVKARVRVDASGRVTDVEIETTPDAMLGACVASALQHAAFDKTKSGGSFSYPFVF